MQSSARLGFPVRGASALFLVLLSACSGGTPPRPAPETATKVTTVTVTVAPVERTITAVGTLEPEARVQVASQAEGVVTAVHVREGDRVAAGQLLVELDRRELEAEMAQATAALEEADVTLKRVSSLRADGLTSAQALDSAGAAKRIAQAKVEALHTRLSFTRITAPVSGIVLSRKVEVGDLASSRSQLLELASGSSLLLRVPVSELEVVKLATGTPATVTVDALPDLILDAHIQRLFPAVDRASRQVTVEIRVDDPPPTVRYGFLARAHLVVEKIPEAIMLPEEAVQRGSEGSFVWAIAKGLAQIRPVTVTEHIDGRALITSGLAVGDQVVVKGTARLRDGLAVKASSAPPSSQP